MAWALQRHQRERGPASGLPTLWTSSVSGTLTRSKRLQHGCVTRILTRLVQTIPFGRGPIHQPKRHRNDSAGDDAGAELRQTISVPCTVFDIAKRPKDETDSQKGNRSRDQKSGMTETMGPIAFCHESKRTEERQSGRGLCRVGNSRAPGEGGWGQYPREESRRGRTMSPTHPEDLRDLALRRSGNRPHGTVPTPGAMRRNV
jgi:hypothetical protein